MINSLILFGLGTMIGNPKIRRQIEHTISTIPGALAARFSKKPIIQYPKNEKPVANDIKTTDDGVKNETNNGMSTQL